MATKNLARTIIEGGARRSHDERHKAENAALRLYLQRVTLDPEYAEARMPRSPRGRRTGWPGLKLTPARRWLASRVGRPWDAVYSELRHLLRANFASGTYWAADCVENEVEVVPAVQEFWRRRDRFWVDEDGILRERRQERRTRYDRPPHFLPKARDSYAVVQEWLHDRKVGKRGVVWFWFEPTTTTWRSCPGGIHYGRTFRCPEPWREHRQVPYAGFRPGYVGPTTYPEHRVAGEYHRQTTRLTPEEVRRWERFVAGWFGDLRNERREALEMML